MRYLLMLTLLSGTVLNAQKNGFTRIEDHAVLEADINRNSAKITSITSAFVQEKKMEYLDEVIVSKGKFWYKRESKLRWQYNEPYEYIIAIKDGKFSIKDNGRVKVFDVNSNQAFKELNDLILNIAQGNLVKDNRFDIEAYEDKTSYFLKLTPKDANMKKFIRQTEVYLLKEDLAVTKVVMRESDTDFTVISFINRKLNDEVSDTVFDIK
ncbi:MAG: outer membrane lipoprotein carrier protein LolA [Breznakibacter sp.]